MVRHAHGQRHLSRKPKKDIFDYSLYFFMIATPMFELAQAWTIYSNKRAGDVSLATWGFFLFSSAAWLIYAVRNKLFPMIVAYTLYIFAEGLIVIGILTYS